MADVANVESLIIAASGSVGGVVFSRNQHGPYTRPKVVPLDPNTPFQQIVRAAVATLTARWRDTLTSTERRAWDVYATNVHRPGRIGRRTNVGGLGMYVRSNVPRIQAAEPLLPVVDTAPSAFDLAPYAPFSRVVLNIVDDTIHPFWIRPDAWIYTAGSAMLFWISRPQPLTVNFWKGPYRYADCLVSQTGDILKTPATIPIPFPAGTGERVFVRVRVTRGDGRLTSSCHLQADYLPQIAPVPTAAKYYAPPLHRVTVAFDRELTAAALDRLNWSARYSNQLYGVTLAYADGSQVFLHLHPTGFPAPGRDRVFYEPPPFDVTAWLTSVPAAAFIYPLT